MNFRYIFFFLTRHGAVVFKRRGFWFVASLEEKRNFKSSFIHILRIMHLNVTEVELKIRENEKCKVFF